MSRALAHTRQFAGPLMRSVRRRVGRACTEWWNFNRNYSISIIAGKYSEPVEICNEILEIY
ncbi:MAG: hypothetical protein V3V96_12395, partial [Acidiferrobacterales bacterium]